MSTRRTEASAFTLIEILVVIAIIGVLSSVVLSSLNTAREKSRQTAAKEGSAAIEHGIGSENVGWWSFDECSGAASADNSGNGGTVTFSGAVAWSVDTPSGRGCSLSFDGTDFAGVSADKDIEDVRTGSATRTLWFKTSQTTSSYIYKKTDAGDSNGINILIGNASVGQLTCRAKGSGANATVNLAGPYNDNKWHFVACILDRATNKLTIIADGTQRADIDASVLAGVDINATSNTFFPNNLPAYTGLIDEVRMYSSSLTITEVQKHYAEEMSAHSKALAMY